MHLCDALSAFFCPSTAYHPRPIGGGDIVSVLSVCPASVCTNLCLEHKDGFQYNFGCLFSIMSRCAISNIFLDKSKKIKVTHQGQIGVLKEKKKWPARQGVSFQQNYLFHFEQTG